MQHYDITIMVDSQYSYEAENVLNTIATANKAIFQDDSIVIDVMDLELYDESSGAHLEKENPMVSDIDDYLADSSFHIRNYTVKRTNWGYGDTFRPPFKSDTCSMMSREGEDNIYAFFRIDGWNHKRVHIDVYSDLNTLRDINSRIKDTFDHDRLRDGYTLKNSLRDTVGDVGDTMGGWWDAAKDFYKEKVKSRLPGGKDEEELI